MAIKYVPYFPSTVSGQAVLDNFVRTQRILKYRESDKVTERIVRGMPLYEVTETELVGDGTSDNMIIHGECVSACAYLKEQGIKIDLVYIDPPFASGADYAKKVYIRRNPLVAKAIKQAEQELEDDELKSFEEKMYGDIWDKEKYLNWMYENLMAIRSVMSENASIYVHLDWHIGHYVKILLDEIFGEDNFLNEIVWCYNGPGSPGMKQYNRKHDTLFWYSKTPEDYVFNDSEIRIAHSSKTIDNFKRGLVGSGFVSDNYDLNQKGKIPEDWWQFAVASRYPIDGIKRVEYATEKPFPLIERIIKGSSKEGMLIADFFGGSGVTATAAHLNHRRFIHVDININSIQTARDRLVKAKANFSLRNVQDGVTLYRNPVQTKDAITRIIPGLRVGPSIGSMWIGSIMDTTYGSSPVYVPDLMDSSSRILDIVTLNRIINDAMPQLPPTTKRVIIYYVDITDRQELEDFIKDNNDTVIEIEFRDLKELLDNAVLQDDVEYTVSEDPTKMVDVFTVTITRFYSDRVSHKINEFNQKAMANSKKKFMPIELSFEGLEAIEMVSLDCTTAEQDAPWHSDSEIKIEKDSTVTINGRKTSDFWDGTIHADTKPLRMKIRNICGDETIIVL
ncbi:MAG: site-specific DNA-methyltransferase [Muribaculaceae bacterium]